MTAREAALKALYSIEKDGAFLNAALNTALKMPELSAPDKGFVTELIYGVIDNKSAIDYIITQFSKIKIKKMTLWVLNILRMGIYQIYYMDKIPHSAACNEAVKLSKKYAHSAASGFVNGALRAAARGKDSFMFPKSGDAVKDLSLEYSYPEWMTKRLVEEYGIERCRELFEENKRPHQTFIRINTLKTDMDTALAALRNEGLECEIYESLPDAAIVKGKLSVEESVAYRAGLYSLQNISSQKAVDVLSPNRGEFVIDMCAAPGGKSCYIAERMKNEGKVISFDIYEHKIDLIKKSAARLGIKIIEAKVQDGAVLNDELLEKADKVLLDAPCSGLGVIHKKPDIKWTREESDIESLKEIQRQIIENAAAYVKKGGVLLYSTCTILPEENRQLTEWFLKNHSEFKKDYEEQILTSKSGESGFYICRMIKE